MTGDSDAIIKNVNDALFSGSFVISGKALARVTHVGNTSMEVKVETYVEHTNGKRDLINRAFLTEIGLGDDNRPAILPRLILETEEDRKEWERAEMRRNLRAKQRKEGFHFYGE